MKKLLLLIITVFVISAPSFSQLNSGPNQNPPAPVFVKPGPTVTNAGGSGCKFLVLEDNLPWNTSALTDYMTAQGDNFTVANSSVFPGLDFSQYDVIVVASDQNHAFHLVFQANFAKFVNFVTNGGSLEVHSATCGWNSACTDVITLPGGVVTVDQFDSYNDIADPTNPIVNGVSNHFFGHFASHAYFTNLVPATDIITITTGINNDTGIPGIAGLPTTIQYHYGSGLVTATSCTYEFSCQYSFTDICTMMHNDLSYSCNHSIAANPVPTMSQWGLIIFGIFLLIFGTLYILRRKGTAA